MTNFLNFPVKKLLKVTGSATYSMTSHKCTVAVCQFTATSNKENNLRIVKDLVSNAAEKNAKIVFLPEASDYIANDKEESKALAETLSGTLMSEYRNLAKSKKVWLSVGGFHERTQSNNEVKIFNSHVLIDDNGEIQSIYKKMHLFDVTIPEANIYLRESDTNAAGNQIVPPVMTPAGPLALAICYDLRFPELSILQRKQGANILTYPSAFTHATGLLHWEILLRARAIETQCYVIAAAQYGKHNEKRTSFGQAMIVDPQGKIVTQCPKFREDQATDQSIAIADIDVELINKVRREMPVLNHRRDDIYQLKEVTQCTFPISEDEIFNFANIVIPGSTVFYRTKYSFAFTNIRCVVPGHVLISTIRCRKRLEELTEAELADFFATAVKVQKVMETVHSASSSTLCVQDGRDAGQTVPCYDLRFPELSILQRKQGANILTYPSAFTHATGLLHWEILLRARAIETQCYVIAAAQYGKHNEKRTSFGQAMIVDPQGKIVTQCPRFREDQATDQSIAIADIDVELINKVRREMPVLNHRRDDIYQLKEVTQCTFPISEDEIFNFANIVIPGSTVFYRTKYSFAFTNIRCVVPGHVLISTIRCRKRLEELTEAELADFFATAVKVQKVMETVHSASSSTLCVQDGRDAGQTVPHVHIHILPRKANDFEVNDEIYDKLARHDRSNSEIPLRSPTEMGEEASVLRKHFY